MDWTSVIARSCLTLAAGWLLTIGSIVHAAESSSDGPAPQARVERGLQILYDFAAPEDSTIQDASSDNAQVNLTITDRDAVRHSDDGLEVVRPTIVQSERPPARLMRLVQQSNALSVEVWIRPENVDQKGPARIVTISQDSGRRNFTLGQEGDLFEIRLRTNETSDNGMPAVRTTSGTARAALTHLVYTRNRDGTARVYVNGQQNAKETIGGGMSNWDGSFRLGLANEFSKDRPWQGTYRLVAIYSRALSEREVQQNFRVGPSVDAFALTSRDENRKARVFETKVAPLLANHCLECHDAATHEGGLVLSHKKRALAGGDSGVAVVAGKADESPLWQLVEADEMPRNREPLSTEEKQLLKQWIDDGATWSLDQIDPAVYVHGDGSQKVFVQRLTVPEYIATVRDTVGIDISKEAKEWLPRDLRADGFSNTAYNLTVDLNHVEAYARLAELIVARMDVTAFARKYTKSRELSDENLSKFIEPAGKLLLRGPLSNEEIRRYCGVSTSVAGAGGSFEEAVAYILEAMLQSPRFVYRIEHQRGYGGWEPVSQYELATRLSYIVWGGPPDAALLQAADQGELEGDRLGEQVERMLEDPRAVERSRQFISEWLNLGRLENLRPDSERFPQWDEQLAADMRAETLEYFEEVAWRQHRPLVDLLRAPFTFVTARLADHYGLEPATGLTDDKVSRYDLDGSQGRSGGLLTHGSVLTVGGDEASTVTRGLFVMHQLLRGVVRDPPPCVDTTPVPSEPGLTKRAIAETRLGNASCAGCHIKFEPLSFGLEKFDGLGSFHHTDEHGNKLREDGTVLIPGQAEPIAYQSSAELMDVLANSPRVAETMTWKVTQFAVGRPLGAEDAPIVAEIHRVAQEGGGTYQSLMKAIVLSDLVRMTRTQSE